MPKKLPDAQKVTPNLALDIIFSRGGIRPTEQTAHFYKFLKKLAPLYDSTLTKRWTKQFLIRCITNSYTSGRFLKKIGKNNYYLLTDEQVHDHIVVAFRAIKTRQIKKIREAAKNLASLSEQPPQSPTNPNTLSLPTNHTHDPSIDQNSASANNAIFYRVMQSLTPNEKQCFAGEFGNYESTLKTRTKPEH